MLKNILSGGWLSLRRWLSDRSGSRSRLSLASQELFYFSSLSLAVLIVLEIVFPRIVLAYFNLNYLFLLVLASGLNALIKK